MKKLKTRSNRSVRGLSLKRQIIFSLFVAIIILLSFTPLGFISLPFIKATTVHIPVILGAMLLGPASGAGLGLVFGLCSLINNSLNPSLLSFCFSPLMAVPGSDKGSILALIVVLVPRILTGLIPALLFQVVWTKLVVKNGVNSVTVLSTNKTKARDFLVSLTAGLIAALGSLVNTVLVMGLIYKLFGTELMSVKGLGEGTLLPFVLGVITANGIPELIVAFLFSFTSLLTLRKQLKIILGDTYATSN